MSGLPKEVQAALSAFVRDVLHASRPTSPPVLESAARVKAAILAALAAARAEAVEECAFIADCESLARDNEADKWLDGSPQKIQEMHAAYAADRIAEAIRSLLPAPKQGDNERERA